MGPFSISDSNTVQIIGWISEVVPFSPQKRKPLPGSVTVANRGVFVARFSLKWTINGVEENRSSDDFPALASRNIEIPANAIGITVNIDIMTFPKPAENWSTVKTVFLEGPMALAYELSGTTFDPKVNEKRNT